MSRDSVEAKVEVVLQKHIETLDAMVSDEARPFAERIAAIEALALAYSAVHPPPVDFYQSAVRPYRLQFYDGPSRPRKPPFVGHS